MQRTAYLWPVLVVVAVFLLTTAATRPPVMPPLPQIPPERQESLNAASDRVDDELGRLWKEAGVTPADTADDLTVLRRLSLALHGTIPSLEEIRLFEADDRPDRLQHWTSALLEDDRFADYFAERLARAFVGAEQGQFLIFRRDRFLDWLSRQLREHVPYDQIVRSMIQGNGVWTGKGEVNFLTAAYANGEFDPNTLAARAVRAFLGQRIDCAQCHDHPFDHWTQSEFEGLAAHFGQVSLTVAGVADKSEKDFIIQDRITLDDRMVEPSVPFHPEWKGDGGEVRERLARWITHPQNQRFERATANRIWGLMFGKPFAVNRPVDDLPDPGNDDSLRVLDLLGADFREHGYDLRQLIQVIASTSAFRMQSTHPMDAEPGKDSAQTGEVSELLNRTRDNWAVFPLVQLRPEQLIGAMLQANHVHTIDQNSHLIVRAVRFFNENDFVDEFGDPGSEELQNRAGTIPQALLRMNGSFADDLTEANPFTAAGRIALTASTPETLIETIYLVCLTRRPTTSELGYFRSWLTEDGPRKQGVEDLFWTLFNSPEFSWNH